MTTTKKTARKSKTAAKAKKAAKANARTLIAASGTISVVKGQSNPFKPDTVQFKNGAAVMKAKTVEAAREAADSWTVRELVKRGVIKVTAAA